MASGPTHRSNNEFAKLTRKLQELIRIQPAQIGRIVDLFEQTVHQYVRATTHSASSKSLRA